MACSLHLRQYLPSKEVFPKCTNIHVPLDTLTDLHRAVEEQNPSLLAHLLSSDRLYPQLATICSKLDRFSLPSEYCYADSSNKFDIYTHFTSPLHRYFDIEVQRMLLQLPQATENFVRLCDNLNLKEKNAQDFQRELTNVRLALKLLTDGSRVFSATISLKEIGSLELAFSNLELSSLTVSDRTLMIKDFMTTDKECDFCEWKLRITTLNKDLVTDLLKEPRLPFSRPGEMDENTSVKAFSFNVCSNDPSLNIEYLALANPVLTVEVSPSNWFRMLQFVNQPTNDNISEVKEDLPELPPPPRTTLDLNQKDQYPFLECEVKSPMRESDVLKVWLTWSMREPIVTPAVQLVEISPLLRVCLQHNTHPAESFSDPNLLQASSPTYPTIDEYISRWEAVFLAEASERSTKGCQPAIIRDVLLKWPELNVQGGYSEEMFYIPTGSVKMTLHNDFVQHCYEFFRISVGDFLCVRYGCDPHQSVRGVYHFVVHQVEVCEKVEQKDEQKEIHVFMKAISEMNCRVTKSMKSKLESGEYKCEVQIIQLDHSYR